MPPNGVVPCDRPFWALNLQDAELMGLLLFCFGLRTAQWLEAGGDGVGGWCVS